MFLHVHPEYFSAQVVSFRPTIQLMEQMTADHLGCTTKCPVGSLDPWLGSMGYFTYL